MDNDTAKMMDQLVLAKRLEEIPLLKMNACQKVIENNQWIQEETTKMTKMKETQNRLSRMLDDRDAFLKKIQAQRHAAYLDQLKAFDTNLAIEKVSRLEERKLYRKDVRKGVWAEKRALEAKRKEEEEKRNVNKHKIIIKEQKEKCQHPNKHKKGKGKK